MNDSDDSLDLKIIATEAREIMANVLTSEGNNLRGHPNFDVPMTQSPFICLNKVRMWVPVVYLPTASCSLRRAPGNITISYHRCNISFISHNTSTEQYITNRAFQLSKKNRQPEKKSKNRLLKKKSKKSEMSQASSAKKLAVKLWT